MKKRRPGIVVARPSASYSVRERASDDELAMAIVDELHSPIERSRAIDFTKSFIRDLREFVRLQRRDGRPSDTKERAAQLGRYARALICGIDSSHDVRSALSFTLVPGPAWRGRESKMREWLFDLNKIADELERLQLRGGRVWHPKLSCAFQARQLIDALSPAKRLTKGDGSQFYLISSWLWQAASGEKDKNMKRACDKCIDSLRRKVRAPAAQ